MYTCTVMYSTYMYTYSICYWIIVQTPFSMSGGMEYQYQTVSSQLFASPVATAIVGSTLQEVCHSRMLLCRDLLILLCVLKYSRIREVM